ncbi:MAG: MFS transporter [Spirochaetia bacterium]|nr:MFS transporter [Spirochaetia bacterium]
MNKKDPYASLRNGEFRRFISARFFFTIAMQIQAVVVGWQIYDLTGDPLALGLIGLAEAIPALSVALYAGHIADRFNRKSILIPGLFALLFCSVSLTFLSTSAAADRFSSVVNLIYAVIFISGIARGFLFPALFSFWSQLIPRNLYANASVWNSTIWQTGAIAGPALGGILYGFYGLTEAYLVDTSLVIVALALLSSIPSKPLEFTGEHEDLFKSLTTGVKFVFRQPVLLGALSLDLFAVLFGGATALLPIFAKEILETGPEGLGILRSAPSAGAILMAGILAYFPPGPKAGRILLFSVFGYGISMILFAVSTNFYLSLFLLALSGAFDNVSVVIRSTIVQLLTPNHMRGRVSSVNSMFIGSSNEIGAFESGVAARLMGTVVSVVFGGSMTLLVVSITAFFNRNLRKLNLHHAAEDGQSHSN